jgi:hypothetical protein
VRGILEGSNDEELLYRLYTSVGQPSNRSQELFARAWEVTDFIASDGFEWVFEQAYPPDRLAAMLADIGFQDGAAFIRRAESMVPAGLRAPGQEEQLFEYLRSRFDQLKELFHEYLGVAGGTLLPAFGEFVRANRQDFEALLR